MNDNPASTYTLRSVRWPLVALFGALFADLAETLVDPADSGAAAPVFAAASQHEGRMIASAVLLLASSLLVVPAVFGLVRPLCGRGRRVGRVAACLALLGALGHAALTMLYLVWVQVPKDGADRAQMLALLERITSGGPTVIVMPLVIAFPLCLIALFVALVRAGVASRWVLLPIVAAPVAAAAVPGPDSAATATALACMLTAACIVVGGLVVRQRRHDEAQIVDVGTGTARRPEAVLA